MSFKYNNLEELKIRIDELGVNIPVSSKTEALFEACDLYGKTSKNRILFQPMEGCDGTFSGSPDSLTYLRYESFAKSGAGIIWFEAVSITEDGRANPRQLWINGENVEDYKRIVEKIKKDCFAKNNFYPIVIMQATHSGRYARPHGKPNPIIAYNNPLFEKDNPIDKSNIITDERLEFLETQYAKAAYWAKKAGFDGIDIKCCHRYLASELLSAFTREGRYGGSFENRTRFLLNSVKAAKAEETKEFFITVRLNAYDGFPYPYGFGVLDDNSLIPNYSEPLKLCEILHKQNNIELINITIGNPYVNPHVNRPYDVGSYIPNEEPLIGVERILNAARTIKKSIPDLKVVCSGISYLRQFAPNIVSALLENNEIDFAGFGRMTFAFPEFVSELKQMGSLSANKSCITCGKCTELMRAGTVSGCVIRNQKTYMQYYKDFVLNK